VTSAAPLDDRRAALVAAGLVGAVVVVLGFGSGIGSVLSRDAADHPGSGGRDLGTEVQPEDAVGVVPSGSTPLAGAQRISATTEVLTDSMTMPAAQGTTTSTTPTTSPAVSTPGATGGSPACAGTGVVEAALSPFLVHLDKAHLEESPGQQVDQALDLDQYVQTHTVLVEAMLQPVVDSVLATLQALPPFWSHLERAHLEESPGEQVDQALDVDQYVQTHTVLVEDMLTPAVDAVAGAGCVG
jgi:hypothetical protein